MIGKLLAVTAVIFLSFVSRAQLYFPPNTGTTWETITPEEMGYCEDSVQKLYDYLEETHTDAFMLLKDGKIVLEKYFGTFTQATPHVWNSAGKTLTALTVGIAQEEGYLSITDTTSDYLGVGWTSLTPEQEEKITIRNQLTMTSGLNDAPDPFCTEPVCLTYLAEPGTRWTYHNAPYTLLDSVIFYATGQTLNSYVNSRIKTITGMTGSYFQIDYNNIFISNARSFARFGILLQGEGVWNGTPVLDDPDYFYDMTHTSQALNESYGYLTWLNGQDSYMIPQVQFVFNGSAMPNAPSDMYCALGKESQLLNVSPSEGLILVRMGDENTSSLVSTLYNDTIWQYVNRLQCTLGVDEDLFKDVTLFPNPAGISQSFTVSGLLETDVVGLYDIVGNQLEFSKTGNQVILSDAVAGTYFVQISRNGHLKRMKLLVN